MEYFDLPHTDLKVSRLALGCMRIANKSVEEVMQDEDGDNIYFYSERMPNGV